MTTVYLAGKMSGLTREEMTGWRKEATRKLFANGFSVLDPTKTVMEKRASSKEIVTSNKYQIQHSDVILAELDYEDPSFGTIGEIIYANLIGKPVIVWGSAVDVIFHPWIDFHWTIYFPELDDALDYITANYGLRVG